MTEIVEQLLASILPLIPVLISVTKLEGRTKSTMVKKTGEVTLATATKELVAVNQSVGVDTEIDDETILLNRPQMQQQVNTIIHEWLTDMWLLTTGEEIETDFTGSKKHNGRPLAIVCDGQMKLMESKMTTLDALRSVGIEMS
jgi:hypothetical protein